MQWPIIYVRGYAMTENERDETTADPFCGFNVGSTLYRATSDKQAGPKKFIFQSPIVRLSSEFGYRDVYEDGIDILDADWRPRPGQKGIAANSIVIYRYYDSGSSFFGDGTASSIEDYARGLNALIVKVRELVCADAQEVQRDDFRCYLVAHSMGGLIVRAFLQNPSLGDASARHAVDKVFTYATPHNGIELGGFNVPSWLSSSDMNTFNRERMSQYLALQGVYSKTGRVDFLPQDLFPIDRFFCMVGTNRADYEVAKGLARTFVGHGSDGLVRVENASVWGIDGNGAVTVPAPTAYAYRSHSGYFGIVNSEEAYQNLVRFLFGDIRVDIWLDITSVSLPAEIENQQVEALYQFELLAGPRGKRWYLTRRVAEEDSPACRTHTQLSGNNASDRSVYMSSVFLAKRAKVDPTTPSLAYAMTVGIRTPDYEVENAFWPNQHYEGTYLFRDTLIIELFPADKGDWRVKSGWYSRSGGKANENQPFTWIDDNKLELKIPFANTARPGVTGNIRLIASVWKQ